MRKEETMSAKDDLRRFFGHSRKNEGNSNPDEMVRTRGNEGRGKNVKQPDPSKSEGVTKAISPGSGLPMKEAKSRGKCRTAKPGIRVTRKQTKKKEEGVSRDSPGEEKSSQKRKEKRDRKRASGSYQKTRIYGKH